LGKLIVATRVSEEAVLDDLLARGLSNGVVGLERIGESEIARLEPEITAVNALYSPETGIVDGQAFCLSMLAAAESKGAVISLGRSVLALESRSYGWRVEVGAPGESSEYIDAGIVVDAGGLDADRIAELAGLDVDALRWRQYPCKGDYFSLAPSVGLRLQRLIYPVPQQAGLGIHATLDLAGRIRFGPDIEYVGEVDADAFRVDPRKAQDFAEAVTRYLPNVRATDLTPDYAGIRPKLAGPGEPFRDFVIEEATAQGAPGFVATIGIESPGLTASLAIADRVASLI
jgi:L-2-hydroxyglutarate oxidase LhgO